MVVLAANYELSDPSMVPLASTKEGNRGYAKTTSSSSRAACRENSEELLVQPAGGLDHPSEIDTQAATE
jgi:hypothetical protein